MEALAAVGLAANVLQFVQFSFELFSISSAIKENADALPIQYVDLEIIEASLENHIKALSARCDPDLQVLVNRALEIATQLRDIVDKLKKKGVGKTNQKNKWNCIRQALEIIVKRSTIEDLTSRLEHIREQLQFHLIMELRHAQKTILSTNEKFIKEMEKMKDSASATQTQSAVRDFDISRKLEKLLINLENINSRMKSIESQENLVNLKRLLQQLQGSVLSLRDEIFRQKVPAILESLSFSNMTVRQTRISEAHRKTFEWVFKAKDLPEDDPRSRVMLVDWLQNGNDVYWITGKPGSGKSTLMKFLEKHQSTSRGLKKWAGGAHLVQASFYFWNAGTRMQKSIEGLLQSLLYTILSHNKDLITVLCPDRITSPDRQTTDVWSLTELRAIFDKLILQQNESTKFYFHIDGLDEYEGDPHEVIEIVERLAQQSTYKVCASSRPWNQFQKSFGRSADKCLQLHLFTKEDIERFTKESLYENRTEFKDHDDESHYEELVSEIGQRAQGVFLWVRLVVRSLRDGQFNSDPVSILRQRLDEIPTDLEEFFQQILQSVHQVYGERMARTFLAALASPEPLQIIHYSFLDDDDPYVGWKMKFESISQERINKRVSGTRWRLNGRYKGLLEPASDEESCHVTVDFLHRTLRDFLLTSNVKGYLKARVSKEFDPIKAVVGTLLAGVKSLKENLAPQDFMYTLEISALSERLGREIAGPNVGTRSRDIPLDFQIMDHIEAIFRESCTKSSETLHSPGPILRAAVHHQQFDYVKHRLQNCTSQSELDWILLHLSCYSGGAELTFVKILHGMGTQKLYSCDCNSQENPPYEKIEFDLISELLARGANPNANVHTSTIWVCFLRNIESKISAPCSEDYWKTLISMVDQGVVLDGHRTLWMTILDRIPRLSGKPLTHLLESFILLLRRGLKVDTNLWLNFIFQIPARHAIAQIWGPFEVFITPANSENTDAPGLHENTRRLYRNLCGMFLRLGADITGIVETPPGYRFGKMSWFDYFQQGLEDDAFWTHTDDVYTLFEVFFENGLDPNHQVRGSTLWELLLHVLTPANYHRSNARLLLLFLQYRADPKSARLHRVLGLEPGCESIFCEPEASELKLAVRRELADLRHRAQIFESQMSMALYYDPSETRDDALPSPRRTQRNLGMKRTLPYPEQHTNDSHKRARQW